MERQRPRIYVYIGKIRSLIRRQLHFGNCYYPEYIKLTQETL
jgi:hypothetical protein